MRKIRQVVIFAAGQGTRMLHLTRNKSKHLINVREKPFLAYLLDNLKKAGYENFILVVGFKEKLMKEFLEEYHYQAKIVSQYKILGGKEKEYGTLCPLKCVKSIIGKENFLAVYGDNLYSPRDLRAFDIDDEYNYIAGYRHSNPQKYGILVSDDGFLKKIVEKPKKPISNLINAGLYKFTSDIFKVIPRVRKSSRGEYELTDAISLLAAENKVKIKQLNDYWFDFGNPADIMKLFSFLKKSDNKIEIKPA